MSGVSKPKILLDFQNNADIMIIGLSARIKKYEDEIPLDSRTRSGKIIDAFENIAQKHCMSVYRTNLVKCAPIDSEKDSDILTIKKLMHVLKN